jgi:hypothetical protein
MKKVPVLAQVLDRLRLTRAPQRLAPSATHPMSDRELALAIRELKLRSAAERAERMRSSAMAELRRLQTSVNEENARAAERAHELVDKATKALRDSLPDTFLGRKTQEPFPKQDEE